MSRIHFVFVPLIAGDMCQDFCIDRLGAPACARGTYCKKEHDCHNLFWTTDERSHICIFSGHGECIDRFPVLCREAVVVSRDIQTTTLPTDQIMPTSSPDNIRRTIAYPTPMPSLVRPVRAPDNLIALNLRFHEGYYRNHPNVKLTFQNEGRNLGYYGVFDTGTHETHIFVESASYPFNESHVIFEPAFRLRPGDPIARPAGVGEGYRLGPGVTPRNPGTVLYGVDGEQFGVESLGSIIETITVFSGGSNRFGFHAPEVKLIRPPGVRHRALLGAAQLSPFARAAGIFAVVSPPNYDSLPPSRLQYLDWQLLIGGNASNHAQGYCSPEDPNLRWFPLVDTLYWQIDGIMWLAPGARSPSAFRETAVIHNIQMVLDTAGTELIHLSPLMMDVVVSELESFGARRIPDSGPFPRFSNCTAMNDTTVLSLRIQPGSRHSTLDPLSLDFSMVQALISFGSGECLLPWKIGTSGADNIVLIGTAFLERVVTVFDKVDRRVGMCRRGNNAIQN